MLPVLFAFLLAVVQVGLVLRDQLLVSHAAREAARVAAIDGDPGRATAAARNAGGLDPDRLKVTISQNGSHVTASLRYRSAIVLPMMRRVLPDVVLDADVTMYDETA